MYSMLIAHLLIRDRYVCDECRQAKEGEEIYCLCRQPYDESQ
jgi:nucleosome-remodeling factor subunit BPTF